MWRACERLGILPPGVRRHWDDNNVLAQADTLSYATIRDHEENEKRRSELKYLGGLR